MRYSDGNVNFWAEIYGRARLWEYGIQFVEFIKNPMNYLDELGLNLSDVSPTRTSLQASATSGESACRIPSVSVGSAQVYSLAVARGRREKERECVTRVDAPTDE